jgi:hypothetical protein
MSNTCVPPYLPASSPYTDAVSPYSAAARPYGDLCVAPVTIKLLQDGAVYLFQDGNTFIFN